MAIESSFNPFAQSPVGAQGLMQVMTRVHGEKYEAFGGNHAAFDPVTNLRVGVQVLQECIARAGGLEAGLRFYVGAANLTTTAATPQGAGRADHLRQVASGKPVPATPGDRCPGPGERRAAAGATSGGAGDPAGGALSRASLVEPTQVAFAPLTPAGRLRAATLRASARLAIGARRPEQPEVEHHREARPASACRRRFSRSPGQPDRTHRALRTRASMSEGLPHVRPSPLHRRPRRPRALGRIQPENRRQEEHIELIASENYASPAVMAAQGTPADQQVRRGLSRQALLRRLRIRRHRRAAGHRPR